jgi:hypothetical protein
VLFKLVKDRPAVEKKVSAMRLDRKVSKKESKVWLCPSSEMRYPVGKGNAACEELVRSGRKSEFGALSILGHGFQNSCQGLKLEYL